MKDITKTINLERVGERKYMPADKTSKVLMSYVLRGKWISDPHVQITKRQIVELEIIANLFDIEVVVQDGV